jgi:hypothetical protein
MAGFNTPPPTMLVLSVLAYPKLNTASLQAVAGAIVKTWLLLVSVPSIICTTGAGEMFVSPSNKKAQAHIRPELPAETVYDSEFASIIFSNTEMNCHPPLLEYTKVMPGGVVIAARCITTSTTFFPVNPDTAQVKEVVDVPA